MSRCAPTSFDPAAVITRASAFATGITPGSLKGPRYERLFRGYYVNASTPRDFRLRVAAALVLHPPGAVASHLTAARLLGLPVPHHPDVDVLITQPSDRRPHPGIRSHVTTLGVTSVTRHGITLTCPLDTFIALGSVLGLVDLVVVGDAMVAAGHVTPDELVIAAATAHRKGAKAARRAARHVRSGVDSPTETRLRMLLVLAGLPEPQINYILRHINGEWIARFDLSYPAYRLIIEYDGRQHAENSAQWNLDIERRESLELAGWTLLVVTSKGIYTEPERTLERVREALKRCGHPLPAALSSAWRPFFPVH